MTGLILASASSARAKLLRDAGVCFEIEPAEIDEAQIKRAAQEAGKSAGECARELAQAKARHISARHTGSLVIGADQLLVCGDEWFDKPPDLAAARAQLQRLRGRTHRLATAACVIESGAVQWQELQYPELTMRTFGASFLDAYIVDESERLLGSVGAYRIEGRGAQLFEKIEGGYFAILGLPLIELLGFLRDRGVLEK